MQKVPMLAEGYEKLTADLKALREERPRIVDAIEEARAHGDLSENAEYHAAKERQGQVEAQIAELEDKTSRAQIIKRSARQPADGARKPSVPWRGSGFACAGRCCPGASEVRSTTSPLKYSS